MKVIKSRLQHKIESQSGASITYALLLFLVCAVVSSVILAAGTAASGRISESVDTDRRYFAVTSAARLLRSEFEKYEVRIDQSFIIEGEEKTPDGQPQPWWREKSESIGSAKVSGWSKYDDKDLHRPRIITMSAARAYTNPLKDKNASNEQKITLSFIKSESDYAKALSVDVVEKVNLDTGFIDLIITSPKGDTNDHPYTMVLTFIPDIKISSREKITDAGITVMMEQTKIGWEFSSMGSIESSSGADG